MKLTIRVAVQGNPAENAEPGARIGLAELEYSRDVTVPAVDGGDPTIETMPSSVTEALAHDGSATIEVQDATQDGSITVRIRDAQGNVEHDSGVQQPNVAGGAASLDVNYPAAVFDTLAKRPLPPAVTEMHREGFFVPSEAGATFLAGGALDGAQLHVAAIAQGSIAERVLANVLGQQALGLGSTRFEPADVGLAPMRAIPFSPATVRADGAFRASLELPEVQNRNEVGWAWMLITRSGVFVGFQSDAELEKPRREISIVLPPSPPLAAGQRDTASGESPSKPPLEFDEQQVLRNPDQFGEDIGSACEPFSNPNRVLGERRFATILRVETPSIGGTPSLQPPIIPSITDLSAPSRGVMLATGRATAVQPQPIASRPSRLSSIMSFFRRDSSARATTTQPAANLRVVQPPSTEAWRARGLRAVRDWRRFVTRFTRRRSPVSDSNPILWEGDPSV